MLGIPNNDVRVGGDLVYILDRQSRRKTLNSLQVQNLRILVGRYHNLYTELSAR
jgi:hypothetical protein